MKKQRSSEDKQQKIADEVEEHLPEWIQIFGELCREAEELYPDGRLRILLSPPRKKVRASS